MSMKLTGEYEFTDDGVRIIGQIHNTKIPLIRDALLVNGRQEMYLGEANGNYGKTYYVPNAIVYDNLKRNAQLKPEDIKKFLNLPADYNCNDSTTSNDLRMAGVMYDRATMCIMRQNALVYSVLGSHYKRRRVKRHAFNVPWIFTIENDGTFDVTLKGMVNRHILTMLLGRASTFAKFLDGPVAKAVKDSKAMDHAYTVRF